MSFVFNVIYSRAPDVPVFQGVWGINAFASVIAVTVRGHWVTVRSRVVNNYDGKNAYDSILKPVFNTHNSMCNEF
jgi:hypothetical protein